LAGVIAAASVVLAGSVYRSMQHQAQETEERLLQQVQLQMKAENLAAQRAVSGMLHALLVQLLDCLLLTRCSLCHSHALHSASNGLWW
jgi:hypothetical protein